MSDIDRNTASPTESAVWERRLREHYRSRLIEQFIGSDKK